MNPLIDFDSPIPKLRTTSLNQSSTPIKRPQYETVPDSKIFTHPIIIKPRNSDWISLPGNKLQANWKLNILKASSSQYMDGYFLVGLEETKRDLMEQIVQSSYEASPAGHENLPYHILSCDISNLTVNWKSSPHQLNQGNVFKFIQYKTKNSINPPPGKVFCKIVSQINENLCLVLQNNTERKLVLKHISHEEYDEEEALEKFVFSVDEKVLEPNFNKSQEHINTKRYCEWYTSICDSNLEFRKIIANKPTIVSLPWNNDIRDWGFFYKHIIGGNDKTRKVTNICEITKNGQMQIDGRFKVGDRILAMKYSENIELGSSLKLLILREEKIPDCVKLSKQNFPGIESIPVKTNLTTEIVLDKSKILKNPKADWGFKFKNKGLNRYPHQHKHFRITKLDKNGVVYADKRLKTGDIILAINDKTLYDATYNELYAIRETLDEFTQIKLRVYRPESIKESIIKTVKNNFL